MGILTEDRQHVELRDAGKLNRVARTLCRERCEHWIPQCERGLREAEQDSRRQPEAQAKSPVAKGEPDAQDDESRADQDAL
jgi:hypothetical protein